MRREPHWQDNAPCARQPKTFDAPALVSGTSGGYIAPADVERVNKAKRICAACPVRRNCETDPMTQRSEGVRHGQVWVRVGGFGSLYRADESEVA